MISLSSKLLRVPILREFFLDDVLAEIEKLLTSDFQRAIQLTVLVWKTSRGVFGKLQVGCYDVQPAPEFSLIQSVIKYSGEDGPKFFRSLLNSESAQLVGYGIIGFAIYDESNLNIPHWLREDKRKIVLLSSARENISLGELVTRIEKEIV